MNVPLLQRLREARGAFVPPPDLGDDPHAVRRDLAELERLGFALEWHPTRGVAYRGPSSRLCPDLIGWGLGTIRVGRRLEVWDRATSTNDLAARASATTANDGLAILAEEQTAGRGRRGRSWSSPRGSALLLSLLLFPPAPLDSPPWLTALGAVAVAEVVESWTGLGAGIKWPNDVRVGGRKVAGVLVERGRGAVIGIGLNVNAAAGDFPASLRAPATSLRMLLTGDHLDRNAIARDLLRRLDARYEEGLSAGPAALAAAWRARLEGVGSPVRVETPGGPIEGLLIEADLSRGLTVADSRGGVQQVPAPDVLSLTIVGS